MSVLSVPPPFPEQEIVDGNVADSNRRTQVRFLRTTWLMFWLSIAYVFSWALFYVPPVVQGSMAYLLAVGASVLLSALRLVPGKSSVKLLASVLVFILAGPLYGALIVRLEADGIPIGPMLLVGILISWLYAQVSGRDFAFLGQFFICLGGGLVTLLLIERAQNSLGWHLWSSSAIWLIICVYLTYNLACVMRRRRPREFIEAVLDMYRDPLNIFTYPIRVGQHWRRYPIWDSHRKG